jgi:hypothetical protein
MSADSELIQASIVANAQAGIASSSNDGGSMTMVSITEQIKAAQFVASQRAASKPHFGLRMTKLIPPGGG